MDKEIRKDTEEHMRKAVEHLLYEFSHIRTGRASTALLDTVKVDYYGTPSPLKHVATVSVPDSRTIIIQPFQDNLLQAIEKGLHQSDLGLTPNSDGHVIRLTIPQLTEERRKDIIKVVKRLAEEGRVTIRNIRRDAIEKLRHAEKEHHISEDDLHRAEKETQELTDKHVKEVDDVLKAKEAEVMTV